MNSEIHERLQHTDNVALYFEGFPSNCSEKEAADLIWFNCGLNCDPSMLSVRGQKCIAVCDRETVAAFANTIITQYGGKLKVKAHVSRPMPEGRGLQRLAPPRLVC